MDDIIIIVLSVRKMTVYSDVRVIVLSHDMCSSLSHAPCLTFFFDFWQSGGT